MNNLYHTYQQLQIETVLPTEILLMIANHLPFKSYAQFSQTCRTLQQILTSTNAIGYLNNRFKFGQDTGTLLLFTYYNILHIPQVLSKLILNHFLNSFKNNMPYLIKGWSLIHAIHCLDPGRFMTLLLADECTQKDQVEIKRSLHYIEKRKKLLIRHQKVFAKEIVDSIIASQINSKSEVCKSKTYQTVFKKLVQSGDLRTVENCLRSLGPPIDCITLSDSDYNNRFPLLDQQFSLKKTTREGIDGSGSYPCPISKSSSSVPIETICRESLYLNYNAHEMRSLTERLLEKYHVKVNSATTKYTSNDASNNNYNNSFSFGSHHHIYSRYQQHRRQSLQRASSYQSSRRRTNTTLDPLE